MSNYDFESAFADFLDSPEYDHGEQALYAMARRGFIAGWRAAAGNVMAGQALLRTKTKYDVPRKSTSPADIILSPKK